MHEKITFRHNTASAAQITAHLFACDAHFVPPLSQRVSMDVYAQKLATHAVRVEAWASDALVGLAAFYANQPPTAYLSNLSVLPDWQQRSIGGQLLTQSIHHARGLKLASMVLEVSSSHEAVLALYQKHGFSIAASASGITRMALALE